MSPELRHYLKLAIDAAVRAKVNAVPDGILHGSGARACKSCSCDDCREYRKRIAQAYRDRRKERLAKLVKTAKCARCLRTAGLEHKEWCRAKRREAQAA